MLEKVCGINKTQGVYWYLKNILEFLLTGFLDVLFSLSDKRQLPLAAKFFPSMQILLNNSDVSTHGIDP